MTIRIPPFFLFLWLLLPVFPAAQVVLKVRPDRTAIRVGDTVTLMVQASHSSGIRVKWVIPDSMTHWEWLAKVQPAHHSTGSMTTHEFQCRFTGYDTGFWPIPAISLYAGKQWLRVDTPSINVRYANQDLAPPFREMKPIIDLAPEQTGVATWWIVSVCLVAAAAFMIYFSFRKRTDKKGAAVLEASMDRYLKQFHSLEADYLRGGMNELVFYDRWYVLLEESLEWKMGWTLPSGCTRLLVDHIDASDLPDSLKPALRESLLVAEKVRFARWVSGAARNEKALLAMKNLLTNFHQRS